MDWCTKLLGWRVSGRQADGPYCPHRRKEGYTLLLHSPPKLFGWEVLWGGLVLMFVFFFSFELNVPVQDEVKIEFYDWDKLSSDDHMFYLCFVSCFLYY